ncbi:hypothetical protein WG66_017018, partial [Moniliophthora roreri]
MNTLLCRIPLQIFRCASVLVIRVLVRKSDL